MAYPIMPTMPLSMAAGLKKSPSFNTVQQKGSAGINSGIALKPYPTWDFQFSLDNITGHEHTASSVVAHSSGPSWRPLAVPDCSCSPTPRTTP